MRYLMLNDGNVRTYLPFEGTQIDITELGDKEYCVEMMMGNRTYVLFDKITLESPHKCMKRISNLEDGAMEFPKSIFY